ncbi:dynamin family protein [uncultured Roseobacter sp.]|uniref:dynamin family protein n=1 Tax=uncultured Roseobacter sp. TaxID=114847 RepID=UPI002604274D|nr:dynamin family protein [uncultured Roseobacter sp.]
MTVDQSTQQLPEFAKALTEPRRPRIALMGEFSAGKSTLANLMIGSDPLPVQVIATQLPPVWISYGTSPATIVDLEGKEASCDVETLEGLSSEHTAFIRIQCEEEILKMCDVIDMPGISDPNMSSEVWERVLPLADAVIWCSPATQAWRQSEASVWEMVPEHIREHSLLLLTRGDMLSSHRDRAKVLKRVRRETEKLFRHTLMVSLTQARDAGDHPHVWAESGAEPFVDEFLNVISLLANHVSSDTVGKPFSALANASNPTADQGVAAEAAPKVDVDRVVPRRPVAKSVRARPTPRIDPAEEPSFTPKFS